MTLQFAEAETVARAALDQARINKIAACVAVCDANGRLLVFFKDDGTAAMSGREAIGRAIASAGSGGPSEKASGKRGSVPTVEGEGGSFSDRPGGLPISRAKETVGAIGVCGGNSEQDRSCAQAGVQALQ